LASAFSKVKQPLTTEFKLIVVTVVEQNKSKSGMNKSEQVQCAMYFVFAWLLTSVAEHSEFDVIQKRR
jgi:hypothetical protein